MKASISNILKDLNRKSKVYIETGYESIDHYSML